MSATIKHSSRTKGLAGLRYASGMEKKPKCKCRKLDLPRAGKVVIRCAEHRGKLSKKRLVCYFDDAGIVRREVESAA